MKLYAILATASVLGLSAAANAQAPAANTAAESQATAQDDDSGTIVVTAQRRTERLRDVPIAVTVVGGDALRQSGATALTDVQQLAPSLQFTPIPGTPRFSIRGIGTNSFDYGIESAVGLAVDDVNLTLPRYVALTTLADIERVEVLRGPQGLLFGKNTTAGLISVTTRRPQLGETSLEGHVQYGTRNQLQTHAIVNLPLGDNAALRLRAGYQYQDPVLNVVGPGRIEHTRNSNLNAKLLWEPNDRLTLYAIGDYQETRGDPGEWTIRHLGNGTTAPAVGNFFVRNQLAQLGITPGPNNRDTAIGAHNYNNTRSYGAQVTMDYDLDFATLTSVTAWRNIRQRANLEVDATPLPIYDHNIANLNGRQITQELRLASQGQQVVDYVAGIYYWNQHINAVNAQYGTLGYLPNSATTLLSNVGGQVNYDIRAESLAPFAQVTIHLGPNVKLLGGLRYTYDWIDNETSVTPIPGVCQTTSYLTSGGARCQSATRPLPFTRDAHRSRGGLSWRGGAEYTFGNANLYATYSRGYKGPAISSINALIYQVDPETVDAFELGVKADLFDRRLSLNIAAFTNTFKDFQAQVFDPDANLGIGAFRTGNAGRIRSRGVEVELMARPMDGLTVNAGVTYLDSKFTDYAPPCYPGQTAAQGCTLPGPSFDASGMPTTAAPKWSTTLSFAYQTDISDSLRLHLGGDWSYRSQVYFGVGDPRTIQPGYSIVNGTIGIGNVNDNVRVSVFARNLFDKRFASLIFPGYFDFGQTGQILPDNAFRRIGVALDFRF